MTDRAPPSAEKEQSGLPFGIAAYACWGLLPLYFKMLPSAIGALEVVANRILWSLLLMAGLLAATGGLRAFRTTLGDRRAMLAMLASASLIGVNWLAYIWAIGNGHIVAASLGYFLNPLVNVALGVIVLKERLRPLQGVAIGGAAIGVSVLAMAALDTLWISLLLALTFAFYGLIRKMAAVGPRQGLAAETLLLTPLAAGYLFYLAHGHGGGAFGSDLRISLVLALSGIVTSVPLLLFATAARRMPLSALGLLQYMSPTLQFLIGVLLYGEALNRGQLLSFALIWGGLILFTIDLLQAARAARVVAPV